MNAVIVSNDIDNELDVVLAYRHAAQLCEFTGIGASERTKIATAISEITRNCLEHACNGKLIQEITERNGRLYMQATIVDKGDGIDPQILEQLNKGTFTSTLGKGLGIAHAKRLTDFFEIETSPKGTTVRLGVQIPNRNLNVNADVVSQWRNFFKTMPPLSPYEEIKRKNTQLIELIEQLNKKSDELIIANDRLKESEEGFRLISASIPDIIWKANAKGDIEYVNKHGVVFTGKEEEALLGWNWLDVIHPNDMEMAVTLWKKAVEESSVFHTEFRIRKHTGEYVWHIVRADAISGPTWTVWVGTMTDIDEHKRTAIELEHQVSERTQELEDTNTELLRSNTDLEQFAYVASHDLTEPIRMVSNFTKLLERKLKNNDDPEVTEFMAYIMEGAMRMQNLISDMLNYSRVGRRDIEWKEVDANVELKTVKYFMEEKLENLGAVINAGPLPKLNIMGSSMIQLFQNLIDNSLKFRSKNPPVIDISATLKGEFWEFRIADNGIGINPKFQSKIFIIFQRLHTRAEYDGTGIGLAMCKKIVNVHGGEIWVEPNESGGSTFVFTLPNPKA
jgi:PAS domain S-box-containing protein